MLQQIKDCPKAAGLIILLFLLTFWGAAPAAAVSDEGNISVDEYYQNKESTDLDQADDTAGDHGGLKQEGKDGGDVGITAVDVMKMIFALLFVVLLLFLLLKLVNKKSRGYSRGQMIQNMGGTPLGGNRSLQVVRVGEKILVLGVGENVQLLNVIEEEGEYNRMIDEYNKKMEQESSTSAITSKWLKDRKGKHKDDSSTFASQLSAQLDEMKAERRALNENLRKKGSGTDE